MVKKFKGNLILTEDTTFNESIEVEGNIKGNFNLKVAGNIDAGNIDVWDIDAWDIDAGNIDAWDIDAWDIDAGNIDAWDIDAGNIDAWDIDAGNIDAGNIDALDIIFCNTVKLKDKSKGKIKAKAVIRKRFDLEQKEFESD